MDAGTDIAVIGGGPAGLTAAYQLSKHGRKTTLLEKDNVVGGLARTVRYKGFRFDIGGHRFFTKLPEVQELWQEILGEEFLRRPRLSRIFYRNQFFRYPLQPLDAFRKLGPYEVACVLGSYCGAKLWPHRTEESFEHWVTNRFGRRLYEMFFKTYTEKVWGISGTEISADWASQRIQNLSLPLALKNAFFARSGKSGALAKTLIDEFDYPRFGPGQMWERCRDLITARGHRVLIGSGVTSIQHRGGRVYSIQVKGAEGRTETIPASHVISSMALAEVIQALEPAPPSEVLKAARKLRYRDFLTVALVVDRPHLFDDNWIYVHSPEVRVGRIQNFKNWSPDMVPDQRRTCLGLEYFVWEGNDLWSMPDDQLLELGTRELAQLGLVEPREVSDGAVVRMRKAYPVYDSDYRRALATIRSYLETLPNLQQIGRNGQHRYNNQDHSMMTALLAADNVFGARSDIWNVNVDEGYHEDGERLQPQHDVGRTVPAPNGIA